MAGEQLFIASPPFVLFTLDFARFVQIFLFGIC